MNVFCVRCLLLSKLFVTGFAPGVYTFATSMESDEDLEDELLKLAGHDASSRAGTSVTGRTRPKRSAVSEVTMMEEDDKDQGDDDDDDDGGGEDDKDDDDELEELEDLEEEDEEEQVEVEAVKPGRKRKLSQVDCW